MQPRKTSDYDLLQKTRDSFGAVAEQPSSGIRYLCVQCYISALIQSDDAKETKAPVRGFLQSPDHEVSYEQVGGVAVKLLGTAPSARRIGRQQRV